MLSAAKHLCLPGERSGSPEMLRCAQHDMSTMLFYGMTCLVPIEGVC